jgi:hypothetical protein
VSGLPSQPGRVSLRARLMINVIFDPRPELSRRKDRRFVAASMTGVIVGQTTSLLLINDATIRAQLGAWTCALITGLLTGGVILLISALLGLPLRITFVKKIQSHQAPGPDPAARSLSN